MMISVKRVALAVGLSAAGAAWASDAHWNRTDVSEFDVQENWKDSVLPDGGNTYLEAWSDLALTMPTLMSMNLGNLYASASTILDLGSSGKTLSAAKVTQNAGNGLLEIRSGTLTYSAELYVAAPGGTVRFTGEEACVNGSQVLVGHPVSVAVADCSLEVLNGASFSASKRVLVGSIYGDSRMVVSGNGSAFTASDALKIGNSSSNNLVLVKDGATLTAANSILLGVISDWDNWTSADPTKWTGNVLCVSNATLNQTAYSISVGYQSSSNRLEILDGATVSIPALTIGDNANKGYNTVGNRALVSGADAKLTVNGLTQVGNLNSCSSTLTIKDGATVDFKGEVNLGKEWNSEDCSVVIDNATVDYKPTAASTFYISYVGARASLEVINGGCFFVTNETASLVLGRNSRSAGSRVSVRSGASLTLKELTVGETAETVLEVENGSVTTAGNLYPMPKNGAVIIRGTNSHVKVGNFVTQLNAKQAPLQYEIPPEGLSTDHPVVEADSVGIYGAASGLYCLDVNVAEPSDDITEKKTYVLFKRSGGNWGAADFCAYTRLRGYDRVLLTSDKDSGEVRLTIRPPKRGMSVIVR